MPYAFGRFPNNRVARVVNVPIARPVSMATVSRSVYPAAKPYGYRGRASGLLRRRPQMAGFVRTAGFFGRYNQPGGGSERKFLDIALSATADLNGEIPATGGQICLIPQGVTQSTRVGRIATIKSVQFNGHFKLQSQPTVGCSAEVVHFVLVLDKQANGAAASVTDLYTTSDMGIAMINMANSSRFTILRHFRTTLQMVLSTNNTGEEVSGESKAVKFYHKCNIPIEFSSTTGALTEIKSNNIFWMLGSSYTDDLVACAGTTRIRFDDD